MARLDPAIRHAITPPEFGENMIHREHLVDRLHGDIPNKLVAIAAPAGYGKTTLLADFVAHTDLPVCWIQVTDADQDLMRLVSVVLASLEKRFRRLRGEIDLAAYSGSSPVSLARTIIDLVDRKIPENFILVMDDVHRMHGAEACLELMDELLVGLPDQMTIFAAGREVLEVSLARLMAEGQLAGFGPHDLALNDDQIRALIRLRTGEEISDSEIAQLRETTRGWITGVILSEFGSGKAAISDGLPEPLVYEYLASVVLNRQKDDIRRFMLDASVLPIMTIDACDAVLARDDSEEMLGLLSDKGLFLTMAGQTPRTYEFHPIFRELLVETLQSTNPERYQQLRERGAHYYREAAPEVAVRIHIDSGDFDKAAEIAEELAPHLYKQGRFSTIESWRDAFPDPASLVPELQYSYARLLLERGRPELALELTSELLEPDETHVPEMVRAKGLILKGFIYVDLDDLEAVREVLEGFNSEFQDLRTGEIRASYYRLRARYEHKTANLDKAIEALDRAVVALRESDDRYQLSLALQQQALVYSALGRLRDTHRVTIEALEIAERYGSPLMRAYTNNDIGQIEYLRGDFEQAIRHLDEARLQARRAGSEFAEAFVLCGQGDVYRDLGLTYQAADLYGKGLNVATVLGDDSLVTMGCLSTAVLHRRVGSLKLASEWMQRAVTASGSSSHSAIAIQSAAIIAHTSPKQALDRLNKLIQDEAQRLEAKELTEAYYFRVLCLHSLGREEDAAEELRKCLDIVDLRSTEQYLAGELNAYSSVLAWALETMPNDPTLGIVSQRIELMDALRARYLDNKEIDHEEGPAYHVTAFGGLDVRVKGVQKNDDMKPQALEVFVFLVDNGPTERDKLSEVFWPDHPPGRQTANLHMAIYSIRQAIGKDMVVLEGSTYMLSNDVDWRYDVSEFERAFAVAMSLPPGDPRRMFALTEATQLYSGPYLPEYFSEWVEERRRELELDFLDVVAANAEEAMRRDIPDRALSPLRDALKVDPYRDDLNRHYLEALKRLDRRSDALSHYQRYASLVREELGLEPSPKVKEVIDSISSAQS